MYECMYVLYVCGYIADPGSAKEINKHRWSNIYIHTFIHSFIHISYIHTYIHTSSLGAAIHLSFTDQGRTLKETESAAEEYAKEDPITRVLMPFGLKFEKGHPYYEMFREAIIEALPVFT